MFDIGDIVICIDASFNSETRPYMPCWVTKGQQYTIRDIHKDPNIDGYGVYLEEVINPEQVWANDDPREWSFNSTRFIPIREWGMEIFERAQKQVSAHPTEGGKCFHQQQDKWQS